MSMEAFSIKWFTIYYTISGILLLVTGVQLAVRPSNFKTYLIRKAESEDPPPLIRNILKYWLLFTLPCLVLAFIPFSWTELLFSIWSLLMVYIIGAQLVRWAQLRLVIQENRSVLSIFVRWLGVSMLSAAVVILLLGFLMIQRLGS